MGVDGGWRYYDLDADESPAEAVVVLVASESNTSVEKLEPLSETIDVGAVNRLFDGEPAADQRLLFRYAGYDVRVTADWVSVRPRNE